MEKVILYIHGKNGSYMEAEQYKKNCIGFDMVGIDYQDAEDDCMAGNP